MKTEIAYIYVLKDPITLEVRYVGKTVKPKNRLLNHISEAKNSKYHNHRLAWIRSLLMIEEMPIFEVVKICKLSEFKKYEKFYIEKYDFSILTNSDKSGQGNINRKKDVIDRIKKKMSREVYVYDLNGEFLKKFCSVREASRRLSISHASISRCCNGIWKHTSGYIFKYDKCEVSSIENPNAVKKRVGEIINGKIINEWDSIMDCSRDTGIDNGNISRICNGKRPHYKKRVFKFL